jgi:prophage regulatory protein
MGRLKRLFTAAAILDIQAVNFTGRQAMSNKIKAHKTPVASSIPAHKATIHQSVFDALPDSAFIREAQLVKSPKRPDSTALLPFSAPTLWRKIKAGTFVKPVKLSERVTAFNVGAVRAWIAAQTKA